MEHEARDWRDEVINVGDVVTTVDRVEQGRVTSVAFDFPDDDDPGAAWVTYQVTGEDGGRTETIRSTRLQLPEGAIDAWINGYAVRRNAPRADANRWQIFTPAGLLAGFAERHRCPEHDRWDCARVWDANGTEIGCIPDRGVCPFTVDGTGLYGAVSQIVTSQYDNAPCYVSGKDRTRGASVWHDGSRWNVRFELFRHPSHRYLRTSNRIASMDVDTIYCPGDTRDEAVRLGRRFVEFTGDDSELLKVFSGC